MNIGIIAHNSKKSLIEDFCIAYKGILMKHEVYATGTTGRRIEEVTNLHVHKFLPGSVGGDKQFTEMIERGDMDMVAGKTSLSVCEILQIMKRTLTTRMASFGSRS